MDVFSSQHNNSDPEECVTIEVVRNRKYQTIIHGFNVSRDPEIKTPDNLLKKFKKTLNCGGSYCLDDGDKYPCYTLQGDHRKSVRTYLEGVGVGNIKTSGI
jgi:translation initiation factor 1 (eIF-1/SUI1)